MLPFYKFDHLVVWVTYIDFSDLGQRIHLEVRCSDIMIREMFFKYMNGWEKCGVGIDKKEEQSKRRRWGEGLLKFILDL
jgi:hypothetical protein